MRREFFTPVGNRVQRGTRGRARLGALAVTTVLGLAVVVSAALPASATRAGDERTGDDRLPVTVSCRVVASAVVGGVATFTVGPRGCEGQTPPLSFSTYTLKDGLVHPFTSQVAFAHAAGNGASYGAGSYTLVAALPECNWQSDLYRGASQPSAPHIHPIAGMNVGWDFREGNVCASVATPSPSPTSATPSPTPSPTDTLSATPTPTPSATPSATASSTPSSTPSATPSATPSSTPSATPSPTPSATSGSTASGTPTYVSEVLSAQANLAATGSSTGPVLGAAVVLVVAGGLLVTLRRRSGQRS